jgi:glyoxylase I family protein
LISFLKTHRAPIDPARQAHPQNRLVRKFTLMKNALNGFHHIAIICSDYALSKRFYCDVLGFEIIAETFRAERNSCKLDLKLEDGSQIELFSFSAPPRRASHPEACGLRHLCFSVADLDATIAELKEFGVAVEPVRVDELTGRRFTFFADPDGLPLELYEA